MLIELIEDRNHCELEFEIVLQNERAKKYYKRTIREIGTDNLQIVKEKMLNLYRGEWVKEAKLRLSYNFLTTPVLIDKYEFQGKGYPIILRCVAFYAPNIQKDAYKNFDMDLELPRINEEQEIKERWQDEFYDFCEYVVADVPLKTPEKFKACIQVYDKNTGDYDEDLSDTEFCDFLESGTFPDEVMNALEGSMAGDYREIEVTIEEDDYYFEEFAGRTLVYKFNIQEIYIEKYPEEYTDAMAEEMGFQDLGAVKEKIKETINLYSEGIYKRAFLKEYYRQVALRSKFIPSTRMLEVKRAELEERIRMHGPKTRQEKLRSLITDQALADEIFADILPLLIIKTEGYEPSIEDVEEIYNNQPDILWKVKSREEIFKDSLLELKSKWLFEKASNEFVSVQHIYVDKEPDLDGLIYC